MTFAQTGTSLLCAAFAVAFLLQVVQGHHETVEKCMKQTGTTCMVKCCMQTHDLVSDDGTLNREKIMGALPPKYSDWLAGCIDKPSASSDPCEKSYEFNHCLIEANPAYFASLAEVENE